MNKGNSGGLEQPTVYVLLPVHNRREITEAFARQLRNQTYAKYSLLLIDDGSSDGTAQAVKAIIDDVVVIRGDGRWWWAGSLQQGYDWLKRNRVADDDFVLIMNDDTIFAPDFLSTGLRLLKDAPGALITATGYNVSTGEAQDSGGYSWTWHDLRCAETYENHEINCSSTRGLMCRVSDFLDVKGFRPRLIPHYLSDIEFTMRAHKIGKRLMIHPGFRIGIHFETTGYREVGGESFSQYIKKVFSKRAAMNPVYWTSLILLHCPWRYKLRNLMRVWRAVYEQGIHNRALQTLRQLKRKLIRTRKTHDPSA